MICVENVNSYELPLFIVNSIQNIVLFSNVIGFQILDFQCKYSVARRFGYEKYSNCTEVKLKTKRSKNWTGY